MTGAPDPIVLGFETSNNLKVRVGLGYKGLAYRFVEIDPCDRAEVVRRSGQHLTPVLLHGETVLFDSAAILRYLEANFRDTPRLFGSDRDEQWAIEDLELFARFELAGPMMQVVHRRVAGGEVDAEMRARCQAAFDAAVAKLRGRLEGRRWLVGDNLSAADVTAAPVLVRVRDARLFDLAADDVLEDWVERVMRYDGVGRA